MSDYPIRVTAQEPDPIYSAPRFSQHPYRAYIVNGAITGSGDTREQARSSLAQSLATVTQRRKEEGKPAIRPGANWPVEFALKDEVSKYKTLSDEFILKVLGLKWAWISDESSLWDFHTEQTNELLYAKIREVYGIDVSDIESAKLWAIFERIERAGTSGHV